MKDGQKIEFTGESNQVNPLCYIRILDYFISPFQEPDVETGDIIIVLDQKDHDKFERKGTDLIYKMVGLNQYWVKGWHLGELKLLNLCVCVGN